MRKLLYIIRSEADFERCVALALYAHGHYRQNFVFCGDFSPFFTVGIRNRFQRKLLHETGAKVRDLHSYSLIGRLLAALSLKKNLTPNQIFSSSGNIKDAIKFAFLVALKFYTKRYKRRIIKKIIKQYAPEAILTDATIEDPKYSVEIFRQIGLELNIPSFVFTHGAAGGLHANLHAKRKKAPYENHYSFVCSKEDLASEEEHPNEFVIGDMRSSYDYQKRLLADSRESIDFLCECRHRIAIIQGGVPDTYTSTNAWALMEKIAIDLSERSDVAIVIKKHPRERNRCDYRMLETLKNVKLCDAETDRSRLVRWATTVVCNDHCSAIFEAMIAEKAVIALEGVHVPRYRNTHSPIADSSALHLKTVDDLDLDSISPCDHNDPIIDRLCWGGNGKKDLRELFFSKVDSVLDIRAKRPQEANMPATPTPKRASIGSTR